MKRSLKNKVFALVAMIVLPFAAVECTMAVQPQPPVYQAPQPQPPVYQPPPQPQQPPPQPVVFSSPPYLVVLPGTYIYAVPDIEADVFFYDGMWWSESNGRWYRSQRYDGGWEYSSSTPTFYNEVPRDWRRQYRDRQWQGQAWNYQPIRHLEVQTNWNGWRRNRHWERQNWGVQTAPPPPPPPPQQPPPPVVFSSPPFLIVIPGTYIYVVPDLNVDVFFYDGMWWSESNGRWYRSQRYDGGWEYSSSTPTFYNEVPRDWRRQYRTRQWQGQAWNYQPMRHQDVQTNWNGWKRNRHWERQNWGVQTAPPPPPPPPQQPPPPVVFSSPPFLIVIPGTYIYVVPDVNVDVFFYDGMWWSESNGRWYRSQRYDGGWEYSSSTPTFYNEVPRDWRRQYRTRQWQGQAWNYQPIRHQDVQTNWNGWKRNRHWERQNWGVQNPQPRPGHQPPSPQPGHQPPPPPPQPGHQPPPPPQPGHQPPMPPPLPGPQPHQPPVVVFPAPAYVVVLPGTYIYVATDMEADLFFYDGWWWGQDKNRWYRSQNFNGGWEYSSDAPAFYGEVPRDWRRDYRNGQWKGKPWKHARISPQDVQSNWNGWKKNKHWEKNNWGVQQANPQRPENQGEQPQPRKPRNPRAKPRN